MALITAAQKMRELFKQEKEEREERERLGLECPMKTHVNSKRKKGETKGDSFSHIDRMIEVDKLNAYFGKDWIQ